MQRRDGTLKELDVSRNRLGWKQQGGEFEAAMTVLGKMKRLRELRIGQQPGGSSRLPGAAR